MKKIGVIGVFAATFAFYAAGLGVLPLMDRDEPRFAESAREMTERRDWVVPHFNGVPRYDKPPLIYWLQALAYRVCGPSDFAARLPSALAASATAALIFVFARGLYGTGTALLAAAVFALAAQTFLLAKAAVADSALTLFFTLAVWAGWEILSGHDGAKHRRVPVIALYTGIALGFLAKGPAALLPLVAACVFAFWTRVPNAARRLRILPGILFASAGVALWAVPALFLTHGEYATVGLGRHVLERSFRPLDGHGARDVLTYFMMLPFYFLTIFASFLPWSPFVPAAARYFGKVQNQGASEKYLLTVVATVFLVFTPLATKLPHYTFPALPVLSILMARYAQSARFVLIFKRIAACSIVGALVFSFAILPSVASLFPVRALYAQSRAQIPRDAEFASFGFHEPSLVWYFRRSVRGYHAALPGHEAAAFMARSGARFCVLPKESAAEIFPSPDPNWLTFTASGIHIAKGRRVELVMYLKRI